MTIESLIDSREVLYFVKQEGCEACAEAEPELAKFETKHPTVMILRIDANGPFPARLGLKLRATPTYLFRRGTEAVAKVGMLKVAEIEKWMKSLGGAL